MFGVKGSFKNFALAQVSRVFIEMSEKPEYASYEAKKEALVCEINHELSKLGDKSEALTDRLGELELQMADLVALATYRQGWLDALRSMCKLEEI